MVTPAKPKQTFTFATASGKQLRDLFGIEQKALNNLAVRNIIDRVDRDTYNFLASVRGYISHLRKQAAKQQSEDGIDAVRESALLNRERRRVVMQEGEREAGRLLPVAMIEEIMLDHISGLQKMVLGWANEAAAEMPHLAKEDIIQLKTIAERLLKSNVVREIQTTGNHPSIAEYINNKQTGLG